MTYLTLEMDGTAGEENVQNLADDASEESYTVRISNDAAENGYEQEPGPLTWLNSARITTEPGDDAVHLLVSIGDPRGAFCVTFRRRPDTGAILIHLPNPGEGMAHLETRELHPGTLELGQWLPATVYRTGADRPEVFETRPDGTVWHWQTSDYNDPEPEWVALIPDLGFDKCARLLRDVGNYVEENEPIEDLRERVKQGIRDEEIDPDDLAS